MDFPDKGTVSDSILVASHLVFTILSRPSLVKLNHVPNLDGTQTKARTSYWDLNPQSLIWEDSNPLTIGTTHPIPRTYWSSTFFVSSQKEFSVWQSGGQRVSLLSWGAFERYKGQARECRPKNRQGCIFTIQRKKLGGGEDHYSSVLYKCQDLNH